MQKIYIEVNIPVSGYILKFLRKKYGDQHYLSKRSHLGRTIIQHIKKPKTLKYFSPTSAQSTFTVLVPESYMTKYGYEMDEDGVKYINDLLEILFDENLIDHVNIQLQNGRCKFARQAVSEFLEYYDISEDERSINTAYMSYKRSCGFNIKSHKPPEK